MRLPLIAFALLLLCSVRAGAQTSTPVPAGAFEGIALGQPMADLHSALGDPVRVIALGGTTIWRYLTHGDGVYLDVLVKDNYAESVTVLSRLSGVAYTDPQGIAFGMTPDDVRAKLGPPARESTNSDDGSLDLWYRSGQYAWIYEFHSKKLDFIQLVASPDVRRTFVAGPPATPNDGSSLQRAIWIRPPNSLASSAWIDVFLATNPCGNGGHWKESSVKQTPDSATNDPQAYTVVHATCSEGSDQRDFYFDTRGSVNPT